jgi:DNA-binding protein YbaB
MNTTTKRNEKEEILENLPPPEKTVELLAKANKVSSWMSELKQRSRLRPFVGKSEDGKFAVVIRDYRIESLNADESLETASTQEIVSRLCEAHNDALNKMEEWTADQCTALAKAAGIADGLELPF